MHKSELGSLLSSGSTLRLVTVTLTPPLLGRISKAWKELGRPDIAEEFRQRATAGDYNHLLAVALEYVDEGSEDEEDEEEEEDEEPYYPGQETDELVELWRESQ